MNQPPSMLPPAPASLRFGEITLVIARIVPGDLTRGFVPYYHFRIVAPDGSDAGHINFRIGNTTHVTMVAGHVGFEVHKSFRGRRFAFQACRALAPFIRSILPEVLITCDPDNLASRRTIEALGTTFLDEVPVPVDEPQYARGSRIKRRYIWTP